MRRLRRVLVAGVVLTLATIGLAMLGARAGVGNPLQFFQLLVLPFFFAAMLTGSVVLSLLAQWGTCTLVGFVLLGLSGRLRPEPDLPPAPQPEPEPWRPPTAEEIARALSHPLTETPRDAPGLDDAGQPPPQSKK